MTEDVTGRLPISATANKQCTRLRNVEGVSGASRSEAHGEQGNDVIRPPEEHETISQNKGKQAGGEEDCKGGEIVQAGLEKQQVQIERCGGQVMRKGEDGREHGVAGDRGRLGKTAQ